MAEKTVRADECKGQWIWAEVEGEQAARVKVGTMNVNGRVVEIGITRHPTCGNFKQVWPRNKEFRLAP